MNLSDKISNDADDNLDWVPLNVNNLAKFDDEESSDHENNDSSQPADFNKLYEKNNKEDQFAALYQKEHDGAKSDELKHDKLKNDEERVALESEKIILPEQTQTSVSNQINVAEHEQHFKKIEQEAYDKGFLSGEKHGFEAGKGKANEIIESMQSILINIENAWKDMTKYYEKNIIQLVSSAAEKVVLGQVEIDNEVVERTILHAFELIPEPVEVTIEINPKDTEYVDAIKDDFFKKVNNLKTVSVISNPSIDRGGCKIITKSGEVDAGINTRLDAITQSIIKAYE